MTRRARWVRVGPVDSFTPGTIRVVEAAGASIGIAHCPSGLHALRNRCPHQGAPVCRGVLGGTMLPSAPGDLVRGLEGEVLRCPWHGWEFLARTGEPLFGAARGRVRTYPLRVVADVVEVELPVAAQ